MDKKITLIATLILAYVFLLNIAFFIYEVILPTPQDNNAKITAIVGLLGWTATIYAPFAAFLFLDDWKKQKQYEFESKVILDVWDQVLKLRFDYFQLIYLTVSPIDPAKVSSECYSFKKQISEVLFQLDKIKRFKTRADLDLTLFIEITNTDFIEKTISYIKSNDQEKFLQLNTEMEIRCNTYIQKFSEYLY